MIYFRVGWYVNSKKSISYGEDKKNQFDYKPAPFSYRHLRIDERRKGNGFDQTGKMI